MRALQLRTSLALVVVMATVVSAFAPLAPALGALGKKGEQCPQSASSGARVGASRGGAAAASMEAGSGFAKRDPASGRQGTAGQENAVMSLPLKSVKSGALRMFMGFWLFGQKGWSSIGESKDGSLTALYADGGQLRISILEDDGTGEGPALEAARVGDAGLVYQLQENRMR
ncbi:hypothetical protein T484DRAFT_1863309 [Baffinella frigidus]|nr:hypothetical protein T484DRAFT_1863309 [Cryptophyta sp. CCMP2293]